jgi:hypothetical protein
MTRCRNNHNNNNKCLMARPIACRSALKASRDKKAVWENREALRVQLLSLMRVWYFMHADQWHSYLLHMISSVQVPLWIITALDHYSSANHHLLIGHSGHHCVVPLALHVSNHMPICIYTSNWCIVETSGFRASCQTARWGSTGVFPLW